MDGSNIESNVSCEELEKIEIENFDLNKMIFYTKELLSEKVLESKEILLAEKQMQSKHGSQIYLKKNKKDQNKRNTVQPYKEELITLENEIENAQKFLYNQIQVEKLQIKKISIEEKEIDPKELPRLMEKLPLSNSSLITIEVLFPHYGENKITGKNFVEYVSVNLESNGSILCVQEGKFSFILLFFLKLLFFVLFKIYLIGTVINGKGKRFSRDNQLIWEGEWKDSVEYNCKGKFETVIDDFNWVCKGNRKEQKLKKIIKIL